MYEPWNRRCKVRWYGIYAIYFFSIIRRHFSPNEAFAISRSRGARWRKKRPTKQTRRGGRPEVTAPDGLTLFSEVGRVTGKILKWQMHHWVENVGYIFARYS